MGTGPQASPGANQRFKSHRLPAQNVGIWQSGDKMTVTLTKVIDPAQGADQFTTPGNGNRFVGAIFTIPHLRAHEVPGK
jgi:hypothetical protein